MVICLGGGATEAAVMAMYGIVSADTLRAGGLDLDEAIVTYVRRKYGVIIGQVTAEQLKIRIGAAVPQDMEQSMEVQGQDQVTGLPRPVTLTTGEIVEALQDPLKNIVETGRRVLEKTPPELVADIIDRGVALCGGGALLRGIDKLLTKSLGIPAYLVDNPLTCVVEGTVRGWGCTIYCGATCRRCRKRQQEEESVVHEKVLLWQIQSFFTASTLGKDVCRPILGHFSADL